MKRRRIIVLAVAVALAFAGSAGPRHAQAATQGHDHAAIAETGQSQKHGHAGGEQSHDHDGVAFSSLAQGASHDHADDGQPTSEQGCCYAWCNSAAIIHAADALTIRTAHDEHFGSEKPFQIAALSGGIDPPPR